MGKLRKLILWSVAILLIAFSLGFSAFFLWQALSKRGIADHLYLAENAFRQEKYDEAKKSLVSVLKMDENNELALRILAEIAEKEQRYYSSTQLWKRLLSINPLDDALIYRYVASLSQIMDFRTVKQVLEPRQKSGKLTDQEALALARAELMTWNRDQAWKIFNTLKRNSKNSCDYDLLKADFYLTDGKKKEAEQAYRNLIREDCCPPMNRFHALMRLVSLVPEKEKEFYLKKAAEVQPQQGATALAEYYLVNGKFDEIIKLLKDIPEKNMTPMMRLQLAEAYASLGKYEKIAELSEKLDVKNRREIALKNYLDAIEQFMRSDFKETARALNGARDFSNRNLYLYMKLITDIAQNQPVQDIVTNAKNLYLQNGVSSRKTILNVILPQMRRCVETEKYADGIIYGDFLNSIQAESPALDELMMICYLKSNVLDYKSQMLALKILKRAPEDLNALQYMAIYSMSHGNLQKARTILMELFRKRPDSLFVLYSLARLEEQSKNIPEAEKYLRKALSAHPDDLQVSNTIFSFYMRNDPAKGMKFARKQAGMPGEKKKAQSIVFQGIAFFAKKDYKQAAAFFEKAIQLDPRLPQAYWYLFNMAETPAEKEKLLRKGLEHNPDDPVLLANLASLYASENQEKKAAETYEKLRGYLQKDPMLMINYSEVLASLGRSSESMEYAIKAKELAPDNLMVRECYAMREFERKNYASAVRELEIVLKNNPQNARVKKTLLEAYCQDAARLMNEGSLNDAERMYRKALFLEPNNKVAVQGLAIVRQKQGK